MNIVRKDLDKNNTIITVGVAKADYAEAVEKQLRDYRKKASIPGFRPGNVPLGLVKKMFGKQVQADEINKLISDHLYNYINENKIQILGEPLPNISEQAEIDFDQQENFEFKFDLGLAPEFDVEISSKDKVPYYQIAVSDEMVQNQVKSYTGRYGKYEQEETVEEKDMVKGEVLELKDGKVNEDGRKLSDAVLTPAYFKNDEQKALFVGAAKGATIIFNPAKAFDNEVVELSSFFKISKEEAQDIDADFQFKIEGITRYYDSEVNQELFDKVYGEGVVNSEEEFIERIKASIKETLDADSDYKFGIDAREMLIEKYKGLSFPDEFLKRWLLSSNKNLTPEALEEDYPKMIESLVWQLVSDKIGKANDMKVETTDVEEHAKKIARSQFAQYGMIGMDEEIISNYAKDMLKKEETAKSIIERVAEEKILAVVKEKVKLEVKSITVEEFNKLFETAK